MKIEEVAKDEYFQRILFWGLWIRVRIWPNPALWRGGTSDSSNTHSHGQYGIFLVEWIFCWMNNHGFLLNEYFVEWIIRICFWMNILLNEYFRFKFWMNIELNRFWARFNVWMNFQNVSHRANRKPYFFSKYFSFL